MNSESVVIQSPMSFVGSARRIWRLTKLGQSPWWQLLTVPLAVVLVVAAWCVVAVWTLVFGVLMVPWRLLRRGSRKRKLERLRHAELLEAARRG